MNRALPPGDRGDRRSDPCRPSGRRGAVLGPGGLGGGVAADEEEPVKLNKTVHCDTMTEARMSLTDRLLYPPVKLGTKRDEVHAKLGAPKEVSSQTQPYPWRPRFGPSPRTMANRSPYAASRPPRRTGRRPAVRSRSFRARPPSRLQVEHWPSGLRPRPVRLCTSTERA